MTKFKVGDKIRWTHSFSTIRVGTKGTVYEISPTGYATIELESGERGTCEDNHIEILQTEWD
jgi:hypothetical protein